MAKAVAHGDVGNGGNGGGDVGNGGGDGGGGNGGGSVALRSGERCEARCPGARTGLMRVLCDLTEAGQGGLGL